MEAQSIRSRNVWLKRIVLVQLQLNNIIDLQLKRKSTFANFYRYRFKVRDDAETCTNRPKTFLPSQRGRVSQGQNSTEQ